MTITLQTKSGEFEVEADAGEPLLHAGLRAGLDLPYECATGTCGTCRGRVMTGDVDAGWPDAPGAARLKREKGDVLMCQAIAAGDCLLRVPSKTPRLEGPADLPRLHKGQIEVIACLTHDVIHIEVAISEPVTFEAGQFMVVAAPGVTGGRAYSMVNYAEQTERLVFVIKRKPGGGFSDWLFESDVIGATVDLFGPLGKATFKADEASDLLCVTGGSGIAGIMSILGRAMKADHFTRHRGQLFFGVRTLADGFYLHQLASMVDRADGALDVTLVLSDEASTSTAHPSFPQLRLADGFVHQAAARLLNGVGENTIGFVAGPPPMVDGAIRMLIGEAGFSPQRIRYDKFS
ncbi:MAG: 2Fe-2S iron-sulfur cluster binding domain-containing protein [Geminicoccaceae bacterium]